jgi:hypothetical protein
MNDQGFRSRYKGEQPLIKENGLQNSLGTIPFGLFYKASGADTKGSSR